MLNGIDVILYDQEQIGTDSFGHPVTRPIAKIVHNVLVAPASVTASPEQLNLDGKSAIYTLAIPKGDNNHWENKTVEFFGEKWMTIGFVEQGLEDLVPLQWHKKIRVAKYE